MTLFSLLSLLIVVLYHSVTVAYRHNFVRMENSEKAREAYRRIVPLISSACPPPMPAASPNSSPGVSTAIISPTQVGVPSNTVVLYSTTHFINSFIYSTGGGGSSYAISGGGSSNFLPFGTSQFGEYRLRWVNDPSKPITDPRLCPGGRIGNVVLDPNTNSTTVDDRVVARNIYDCSFEYTSNNRVMVTVDVYGLDRAATSQQVLRHQRYQSEVWLPFYTNVAGGG